jgi:hypothetical protein
MTSSRLCHRTESGQVWLDGGCRAGHTKLEVHGKEMFVLIPRAVGFIKGVKWGGTRSELQLVKATGCGWRGYWKGAHLQFCRAAGMMMKEWIFTGSWGELGCL